jgi:hypothetical protein
MRHFRRSRRHRSHGHGSYAHHGWYGRDEKLLSWGEFRAEALKQKEYRKKNGQPNYTKLSLAWNKYKKGKPLKVSKAKAEARSTFLSKLHGFKSAIESIGRGPKKKRVVDHYKKRAMSAVAKLRAAERVLATATKMLASAEKRVAKKEKREAEKARKKAESEAAKPQTPEQAKQTAKTAEKAQKKATSAAKQAVHQASWEEVAVAATQAARQEKERTMFPYAFGGAGRDKAKKRSAKKSSAKKSSAKKSSAKKSSAKKSSAKKSSAKKSKILHGTFRIPTKKSSAKKRSAKKSSKRSTAMKNYWTIVHGLMKQKGYSLKRARAAAPAAYKKKYGRDFAQDVGLDHDFGRDHSLDHDYDYDF